MLVSVLILAVRVVGVPKGVARVEVVGIRHGCGRFVMLETRLGRGSPGAETIAKRGVKQRPV